MPFRARPARNAARRSGRHLAESPFTLGYCARSTSNSLDAESAAAFGSVSDTSTSTCTSPFAFQVSDTFDTGSLRRVASASATSLTVGCGRRSATDQPSVGVGDDLGGDLCRVVRRQAARDVLDPITE